MIPVVSLPPLDEAPQDAEGESAADLIKKEWEKKNVNDEASQRKRLQTFKFGGGSTTDLNASTTASPSVVGDTPDPGAHSTVSQGLDLPNAAKSASSSRLIEQRDLQQKDTHLAALAGGDSQRADVPTLPDVYGAGSEGFGDLLSPGPSASESALSKHDNENPSLLARSRSTKTTASTATTSPSIPPSLDNTSSRTLSSSSEELSGLAYTRASSELNTTTASSSSPSIGGAGKLKGLPPILRVVQGESDTPVIVENGEDEEDEDRGYSEGLAVADEATVRGDSPRTLLPSQVLAAEATSGGNSSRPSTESSYADDEDAPPPVPPRDQGPAQPVSRLAFQASSMPKPVPATRKRGMTLDASTASRSSSETASTGASIGNAPVVRRKTLNPFKKRGQKDRSVSPGRHDASSPPPTSTLGKIGRSVVGSVLRPSRQQTTPRSPRSPYLQAQHAADDVSSLDQNSPPMPIPSSPRLGTAYSQSPPSSPTSKRGAGAYAGVFHQQQQRAPENDDAVVRQAVSPTFYSHGDIHAETSAIKDEEQRRVTEMAFLY